MRQHPTTFLVTFSLGTYFLGSSSSQSTPITTPRGNTNTTLQGTPTNTIINTELQVCPKRENIICNDRGGN